MEKIIKQSLEQYKREIERYIDLVSELEKDPFILFQEIIPNRATLILELLEEKDPENIKNFEKWIYPFVIKKLEETFDNSEYTFSFNPNQFPSPIYISRENKNVASIYPYDRKLHYDFVLDLIQLVEKRMGMNMELVRKEEYLKLIELTEANPVLKAKGNPLKVSQILIRKKRTMKEIKSDALEIIDDISNLRRSINSLDIEIENRQNEILQEKIYLDRLSSLLKHLLLIDVVDTTKEIEDMEYEFYTHTLEKYRNDYIKDLYEEWGISIGS